MKLTLWAGALALAFFSASAQACSICGCGDPADAITSGLGMAGRLRLSLGWQNLSDRATSGEDPDRHEGVVQNTYLAELGWDATEDLSLLVRLPWNEKRNDAWGGADAPATSFTSGLGDLTLAAKWSFLSERTPAERRAGWLAVSVGSSLNTGANDLQADGVRIDEHAQPGSGAVGPFVGLQAGLERGDWTTSFHVDAQGFSTNASGYQYGSALRFGLGIRAKAAGTPALGLALEGRYADYDRDRSTGELQEHSGGTLVAVAPSLGLDLWQNAGLLLKAQLPLYQALFGQQTFGPTVSISTQFIFM